jgi:wobble nucleotide-excising tRNase
MSDRISFTKNQNSLRSYWLNMDMHSYNECIQTKGANARLLTSSVLCYGFLES